MNLRIPLAIAAAALGVALSTPGPAAAGGSFTWTGEGDGRNWTNECNWWPKNQCKQSYPGMGASDDDAVIAYIPGKTPRTSSSATTSAWARSPSPGPAR